MLPISVCIIGRDEEKNIERCLKSLVSLFSDIIYVDTGSTDQTVRIASHYLPRTFHFKWTEDFSAARNYSISLASNDWILAIDCDEYLINLRQDELIRFMNENPRKIGKICRHNLYQLQDQDYTMTEQINRLFPKKYYHYQGIIHEQLVSASGQSVTSSVVPVEIGHSGYSGSAAGLEAKARRNIHLLLNSLKEHSSDTYLYFQLGQSYFMIKDYENAITYFRKAFLYDMDPAEEYVQMMMESYGYSLIYLKKYEEALQLINLYDYFCHKADFVFLIGLIYMNNAMFDNAITEFEKAATLDYHSVEGVNSYLAFYNIGVIYECLGQKEKAIPFYKKCGDYENAASRIRVLEGETQK